MKNKNSINKSLGFIALILLSLLLVRCQETPEQWAKDQEELQMMEYIEADSADSFSDFIKIADEVGMSGILSTRGPFTLFLPDNEAFQAYYQMKGKTSYNDFTNDELLQIIRNHVVAAEISSTNIGLGALSEQNALGDYLVSEFQGTDIIINKHSKIIDRDIYVANGVIHRVNAVIDPVTQGTYETLTGLDEFSIFTKGLELAGLSDTLNMNEIPYGASTARVRYTILAETDSVYKANGISSVEDLVARYDDGVGSLSDLDNKFYQYMVYHCLENTYYMSDITSSSYYVITRENFVTFDVGNEFIVNPGAGDTTITTLMDRYSNIPTKNGVIHALNQVLTVPPAEAKRYVFDTTSFPEFEALDEYGDGVRNFYDGENDFAKVKWTGDYLQYWCKSQGTGFVHDDCIIMSEGFWTLEVTTPKIARGNYHVTGMFKSGFNRANVVMYIDGNRVDQMLELNTGELTVVTLDICDVNWTNTQEHVIKMETVYPGIIMWDNLTFDPL